MWWPYQLGIEWLVWRYRFASTLHWNAPIQVLMGMAVHSSCNWLSGWCDQHYSMVLRSWYTGVSLACHLLPIGCIRTFLGDLLQHVCSHWLTNCSIVWDFVYTCKCPTFHQILLDSSLTWTKRTVDKLQVRAIYWIYGHYVKLEVLMWVFGLAKLTVGCHSGQSPTLSVRYFATNTCHQFVLKQCK